MAEEKRSLTEIIKDKIDNLKTLEIRTSVGNFKWNEEKKKIDYKEDEVKVIMTQIDLLEGDIKTTFSEDFLKEPYDKILDFHAEKEKRGQEIMENNLKAVRQLFDLAVKILGPGRED